MRHLDHGWNTDYGTPYFYGENMCFVNDQYLGASYKQDLLCFLPLQGLWDEWIEVVSAKFGRNQITHGIPS
jgi:hypothetical protein